MQICANYRCPLLSDSVEKVESLGGLQNCQSDSEVLDQIEFIL
jgi:hypothetical protein